MRFTMCKNYTCGIRNACRRYCQVPLKHNQAYYPDYPGDEETCTAFLPNRKGDVIRTLEVCDHYAQVGHIADDNVY